MSPASKECFISSLCVILNPRELFKPQFQMNGKLWEKKQLCFFPLHSQKADFFNIKRVHWVFQVFELQAGRAKLSVKCFCVTVCTWGCVCASVPERHKQAVKLLRLGAQHRQGKWVIYFNQSGVRFPRLEEWGGRDCAFQPFSWHMEAKTWASIVGLQIIWL